MPWQETSVMNQRVQFIADYQRGLLPLSELAGRFGISRKTAYKWIDRYEEAGPAGPALGAGLLGGLLDDGGGTTCVGLDEHGRFREDAAGRVPGRPRDRRRRPRAACVLVAPFQADVHSRSRPDSSRAAAESSRVFHHRTDSRTIRGGTRLWRASEAVTRTR